MQKDEWGKAEFIIRGFTPRAKPLISSSSPCPLGHRKRVALAFGAAIYFRAPASGMTNHFPPAAWPFASPGMLSLL
jgi:hypothetical protein